MLHDENEIIRRDIGHRTNTPCLQTVDIEQRISMDAWSVILRSIRDAVIITDSMGEITLMNSEAEALTGYTSADAHGLPLPVVFNAIDAESRVSRENPFVSAKRCCSVVDVMEKTVLSSQRGQDFYIAGSTTPLLDQFSGLNGIVLIFRDISQKILTEEANRRRSGEVMQAAKMAALGTMTAGIGHEINNPTNFIALSAPLLKDYWDEAIPILDAHANQHPEFAIGRMPWSRTRKEIPRLFQGIDEGVLRIKRIVSEMRSFAKPDVGHSQQVDPNQVIEAAVSLASPTIFQATKRFTSSLHVPLPPVSGSFQKLEQVIVNLLINACQSLTANDRGIRITSSFDQPTNHIVITVVDEGCGIADQDLARLGEPFYTTKPGGTGLGIAIIRRIVRDHGGEIVYTSQLGIGTTATLRLPALDGMQTRLPQPTFQDKCND